MALCVPALCLAQGYTVTTVAGGNPLGIIPGPAGIGNNGPATGAYLSAPGGVALDSAGNIYIADSGDQLIRKVSVSGIITTFAGSEAAPGFSGDGGLATSAKLNNPSGLAVDKTGNVYIADTANNRVREVNTSGIISTVAGSSVVFASGQVGDGGAATSANLNYPKSVAFDASGNLYIADYGNYRVRKVTNGTITTVAGNGYNASTSASGFGEGGPATSAGLSPYYISLDSSGNIFIADNQDNIIRKVNASTGIITTPVGNSYAGYAGDGGSALSASINNPQGVAVDSTGNIFIADTGNSVIREVTPTGTISTIAGMNGTPGSSGDGGLALNATLSNPSALALTSSGLLYIADTSSTGYADARIRLLSPALPAPAITSGGVVPIFSSATTIQAGSWISIYGTNFASATSLWSGNFPTSLGGVSVNIDSIPAYMYVVSPTQINVQAPNDSATGSVPVTVTTASGTATSTVTLAAYAPSFSLLNNKYPAAIVITSGPGNSGGGYDLIGPAGAFSFTTRPVKAGETLILYGVGFGPTNPSVAAGQAVTNPAASVTLPKITIGGVSAQVSYGGIVEAGLFQFNVVVPAAGSGDQLLLATINGASTPSGVYITLQ